MVTVFHAANTIGAAVPDYLLSTAIGLAFVLSGATIAVMGLKLGLLGPFLLIMLIWGFSIYFYLEYELNLLCINIVEYIFYFII
jgi:hypothetical protein